MPSGTARSIGLGLITGAADDDPSAIGTYAAAGAKLGPAFLWTAPVTFPMMFAVVYLSAKLGQVTGKGLFAVVRDHYSRPLLFVTLAGVLVGNTFEAAADLGGMAAAVRLLVPWPFEALVVIIGAVTVALQVWGSYRVIRAVFRLLALVLLAYVASAFLAKPDLGTVLEGTLVPTVRFDREFLSLLVAVIGTSLPTCTRGSRTRKWKRRSRWAGGAFAIAWAPPARNCTDRGATSCTGWCSRTS